MTNFYLKIYADNTIRQVSNTLFVVFLEDINFACDGGLNVNMVNNHSFDVVYVNNKGMSSYSLVLDITKWINS